MPRVKLTQAKAREMVKASLRAKPALGDAEYERLAEFRYLLRRFLIFSENAAVAAGLTAQQHQALLAIKGARRRGDVTTGALAERLGIRHHSAVGLVDRLEQKGLVRRKPGADDRRHVLLSLTRKAEGELARLSRAHREELQRLAPTLRMLLRHFDRRAARKNPK